MIQTKVRDIHLIGANFAIALSILFALIRSKNLRGLNFDMEPKDIIRPSGIAVISVTAKIKQFKPNPSVSD